MFPFYAQLIGAAGAAIGEPGLWAQLSTEQALDLCPPSLQPDGPGPGPQPSRCGRAPASAGAGATRGGRRSRRPTGPSPTSPSAPSRTPTPPTSATGLTALEGYDGTVIATTGRRLDPDELGPLPANVVVEEFVPQAALLERADLLVSHSGSGTMLGGLVHGVPQVALPRGTDQPQNAALLARAGAGLLVAPEDYAVEIDRRLPSGR